MNFDHHLVRERDGLPGLGPHGARQQGHASQKPLDVSHDVARLLAVLRNHHDRRHLAWPKKRPPIAERCEEDGDESQHKRLSAPSTDDEPRLAVATL